jgi:hypothetical protein
MQLKESLSFVEKMNTEQPAAAESQQHPSQSKN